MVVDKPLIHTGESQLLRASGSADWTIQRLNLEFYSVNADRKKQASHAKCTVKFGDSEAWSREWKRNAYLIQSRIKSLYNSVEDDQSHRMKRGMIYKLFSSLVAYGPVYQGMQEVVFDSTGLEATARVQFQTTQRDEDFYMGPYWIDSLGHISGFVMNANDGMDLKSQVFINHGWDSMRSAISFSHDKTYQTYVKMQNTQGNLFAGDVYIFDGVEVVGVNTGVKVSVLYKSRVSANEILVSRCTTKSPRPPFTCDASSRAIAPDSQNFAWRSRSQIKRSLLNSHYQTANHQVTSSPRQA